MPEDKVACRTPTTGRDGVANIPKWKFDMLRDAILDALTDAPLPFAELRDAVHDRLPEDALARLGSLGWHVTSVKLELEVRGEIAREKLNGRQVLSRVG